MSQHENAGPREVKPDGLAARKRPALVPVARTGPLPLSFMQQRLWFLAQLEGSAATYNVHFFVRLKGPLDVPALRRALADIVQRHEALRTTFGEDHGQPVQRTVPALALPLPVEDLEPRPGETREAAVRRRAEEEARHPFDLEAGPLVRATLLRVAEDDHALLFVTHHIVCDAVSFYWMASELNTLYLAHTRGEEPRLPAFPVQYADFAHWQREWLQGEALEAQRAWWTQRLAGAPPVLELPTDKPRPPAQTFRGAILPVPLPPTLPAAVRELARKAGVTPYMTMLAGFGALLSRYSGQSDLVVGTPFAGRGRREVERLIGFFANTLALRLDASGDLSFLELLRRTREGCLAAFARPDMPFEQLVDALVPVRDASRSPLFQVMFVHVGTPLAALKWPGVTVEEVAYEPGVARFDLTLFFYEDPGGWVGRWEYNRDLFDEATMLRMAAHYTRLLEAACASPEETLSRLPLLTEAERHQVLREWNATGTRYPPVPTVHALFEATAARTPDAPAASFGDARLTYAELNRRANRLAHHLRALGVGPDTRVGICVERSLYLAVAVLGTLKAGGAYVPLDPAYPAERLTAMLEASGARVLLTQRHLQHVLPSSTATSLVLDDADAFAHAPEMDPVPTAGPESLTYVIFTSGSTGAPKGVAMHHGALVNLICFQRQSSSVPGGRTLQFSAFSFDVSFQEMLATWAGGGELVLISEEVRRDAHALLELMDARGVERMFLPFVALQNLAEVSEQDGLVPRQLKEIITAGEQLRITPALRLLMKRLPPGSVLHNQYGPTETHLATLCVLSGDPEGWPDLPLIGTPIANASIHLLDAHLQPVPLGVPGELYIGGVQVARGYWGRPDLTVERFVPDPFGTRPGARMYRTGDWARYRAGGDIEFLGRRDAQVKVRGFRIELGEIEATLAKHPAVRDCVVAAREQGPGEKRLVAWVVGMEGAAPETEALKAFLKERLPEYMVPSAWVHLDALPLTPSGKVDRKALPDPGQEEHEAYVAPRTELEALVAGIWAPLLKLPRVGATDHFFERGGHSLLATQVASRLRAALGVELPVRVLFEAPTVEELAERLEALHRGTTEARPPPLVPTPRDGELPLSFSQERLWFVAQLDAGGFAYNVPFVFRLEGRLEIAALEQSLRELTRRHEVLRTTFPQVDGRPVQRIAPEPVLRLLLEDVAALPEDAREATLGRRAREEAQRPFDLAVGPLVRATLLRVAEDAHVLVLVMHHIVCDGWSLGVLLRELKALYTAALAGEAPGLTALPVQYADFARWQRDWLRGEVLEALLAWWKARLEGAPPVLELPTDRPRPPVQSFRGAFLTVPLPEALTAGLKQVCLSEQVTLFMALLAGLQALLSRYSGQEDLVVGSPIAGRDRQEVEGLIGFFVNMLALRVRADGDVSFRELLGRVREACLGAYAHQEVPFEQLVEALRPPRDLSRSPLFQVSFALQAAPDAVELSGVSLEALDVQTGMAKFDLTLFVRETRTGLVGFWEYNSELFDEATVARMAAHYARLLEAAVARPEQRLAELPLLSEAERHQVLVHWNDTRTEYPREACIHALFEAQAARTPDAVAVEYEDRRLTYSELNRRANQLARFLRRRGVGIGTRVGLFAARSVEMVVATLAILKAGGAYVPLDSSSPRERLAFMAQDTDLQLLLVQPPLLSRLPTLRAELVPLEPSWEAFARESPEDLGEPVPAESLAYIMYTSGSTGRPKGVCIPHRGVVRLVKGSSFIEWGPREVFLQLAPTFFDPATLELWGALLHGARLVVFSEHTPTLEELGRALVRHGITTLWLTAALFEQMMASQPEALAHVRQVLAGGDVLSPARVRQRLESGALLVNGYGPTENSTFSTCHRLTRPEQVGASVSIGQPIAHSQAYVLDTRMEPVPTGVAGELYVGGDGLAWGYLRQPELTAERFVPHPFSQRPGARLYRTGDRARWLRDGTLEFLGRRDRQVKVRGFRIEPGEVESALLRHPAVREAVVLAREDGPGGPRLVAYVVPHAAPAPTAAHLRALLKETLPEYMVPSAFVALEALPLTPNGKVDRKALPAPDLEGPREDFVPPRTPMEERVAALWRLLLGQSRVGARDNFFERGGHSLLATQVVSRLRQALQVEVPVRTLFEAPTVAELAGRLEALVGAGQARHVPPLVPVPRGGPLPLSFAQQRLWFIDRMGPGSPVYNIPLALRLEGVLDTAALERAVHALAQRHESLRTTFRQDEHEAVQLIAPEARVPLAVVDLRGLPRDTREEEARRQVQEEARRPFDLTAGPLLRLVLLRLGDTEQVLVLNMHHIISDGWSLGILLPELRELYTAAIAGRAPSLPALPVQYADYARWQREWLQGDVLEAQLDYWREQLAGVPTALELPTDRPRPPVQTFRGAIHRLPLPLPLVEGLRQLGQREGTTLFMTLLAGFQALLSRYSGQGDLVVGSPIAGRDRQEVEGLIGFFVNTLVLRARVKPETPFRSLLRQVREAALGAYAHQELPFERLVEALKPPRDVSRSPLVQVMFALQNASTLALGLPGLDERPVGLDSRVARHDLSLGMWETASGLEGTFEYNTDLFDAATVARMAGDLRAVLEAVVADAGLSVRELPLLSEADRHQLLVEWNGPSVVWPGGTCLHTLFEAHARSHPDALAVTSPGRSMTYGALDARANQLAHLLRARGVGPERVVALLLERSVDFVVGALGILKAGGAYLPLDPAHPEERLRQLVRDSGARAVVTQQSLLPAVRGVEAGTLCLDAEPALDLQPAHAPRTEGFAENLAYLIYTSGSTGRPKGVAVAHQSVVNLMRWYHETYAVTREDRVMVVAGLAFDATVLDLWAALTAGASVHLPSEEARAEPRRLVQWLADEAITLGLLPTPLAEAVLDGAWPERLRLRVLFTGGDRLHRRPGPRFPATLVNAYGPTECTVAATFGPVAPQGAEDVLPHIGRPLANVRVYVLDGALQPVPVGVWGELSIGGQGLARGYLGCPDLTAERFLPDPVDPAPGARMYRTGDLVRWRPDGNLEFGGRSDNQVKLRGFRIELGEIEAAILTHPAVRDAVVVAREDGPGDTYLAAYCVHAPGEPPTPDALRTFLRRTLPEHMVPSLFVPMEAIPLTSNGKPDRRALPAPRRSEPTGTFLAPREGLEQALAAIWADVLRLDRVGAHDNFFESGGHSLLAMRVVARLREVFPQELPVRVLFEAPTVAELARKLESLQGDAGPRPPPLAPVPRDAAPPLSFEQQRLWFLARLDAGGFAYNVPFFLRLQGRLDVTALERGLADLVQRHEVLRTTFAEVDDQPVQCVSPRGVFPFVREELEPAPGESREAAIRRRAEEEVRRPFDLERGPLARATLLRASAEEHVLLLAMHHIVCDLWSLDVLVRELKALYTAHARGEEAALPALPVQYADFAHWQRQWLRGEVLEARRAWWKEQLAGAPPMLELPTDRPRPPVQTFRGAQFHQPLPPGLPGAVQALSRKAGVTPFMLLLAGFHALLARYSGQTDIVVGTPIAGRNRREVENLVGFFTNTLALRVSGSADDSFRELLGRVRAACLGAYAHQDMPFEQLVDALVPVRDVSRTPLFQVMFVFQHGSAAWELPGVAVDTVTFEPGMAKFDLTLFVRETPAGWTSFWEYNTDLYEEATVARLAAHYTRLLEGALAWPERKLASLPLLLEAEERQLAAWAGPTVPFPSVPTVHALFEATAARTPDAVAVRFGGEHLTYAELNRRANQLAHHLRARGVGTDTLVGVCVQRSLDLPVAVLGTLKAGGAYVPLDPAYPPERLALMLKTSGAKLLITQHALRDALPAGQATPLFLDLEGEALAREPEVDPGPHGGPASLTYVIFTSGSTGVPKGVALHHEALVNMLHWQLGDSVAPRGRTLQFSALSFDVSFQELFSTWAAGGELVLLTEEVRRDAHALLDLLERAGIERLFLPFVALQNLAEVADREGLAPSRLKEIMVAGEQLRMTPALRRLMQRLGGVLHNHYGPSEAHAATSLSLKGDPEAWPDLPSIGWPLSNVRVHLLDAHLRPVPMGVSGELYVSGAQVGRGYLGRPDLTADRFLPDPFSPEPGARLYRTGDWARHRADGEIEYLGRRDAQVKVRGFRIELGEIEAALARHPSVRDCIVDARDDGSGQKRLVAWFINVEGQRPEAGVLRAFLKERLPEYMVPTAWVPLEAFPLTPSGKVDRKALPAPEGGREASRTFVGPRTPLELRLVRIWEEVLGVQPVGVRDSFFELGGHSLLTLRLQSAIRTKLGRPLPVTALFQNPTVEHLAGLLREEAGHWSPLVELQAGDGRRPFFCVHAVGGSVLPYAELARQLGPEQPFYGLQARGLDGGEAPCESIPAMAALYVRAVRAVQPQGPYLLGGWSMGGAIAFEMACQLQREGEEVALLALLDASARLHTGGPGALEQPAAALRELFFVDLLRAAGQPLPALEGKSPEERLRALEEASQAWPFQTLHRVFESNLHAAWTYEPPPYTGPLTLFVAHESHWDHGWASRAPGGLARHEVPGDHYSFLTRPHVVTLAALLRDCLEETRARLQDGQQVGRTG